MVGAVNTTQGIFQPWSKKCPGRAGRGKICCKKPKKSKEKGKRKQKHAKLHCK